MSNDLRELHDVLRCQTVGKVAIREDIETAIQALLMHQVVYEDTPGLSRGARLALSNHRDFFAKWFAAAGMVLVHEPREQMTALVSDKKLYGWHQMRLKRDETLVRLALRYILDNGAAVGTVDEHGRVASDTDELIDTYRTLGKCEPPSEVGLEEILGDLVRIGAIRRSARDRIERVTPLLLLPGLRIHVPDSFALSVAKWVDEGCLGANVLVSQDSGSQQSAEESEITDENVSLDIKDSLENQDFLASNPEQVA